LRRQTLEIRGGIVIPQVRGTVTGVRLGLLLFPARVEQFNCRVLALPSLS
jgi:hypothetical protein